MRQMRRRVDRHLPAGRCYITWKGVEGGLIDSVWMDSRPPDGVECLVVDHDKESDDEIIVSLVDVEVSAEAVNETFAAYAMAAESED